MEHFLSIHEAAKKWKVSERRISQYCTQGRIPGAQKFGRSWAIPEDAKKPEDPRQARRESRMDPAGLSYDSILKNVNLMPLMNAVFEPGNCQKTVRAMARGPHRDIAWAEYYYFSGQPEKAARAAKPYLASEDMGARLSAYLIYAYANLSIGRIPEARSVLEKLNASLHAAGELSPQFKVASAFVALTGAVLLHLPLPEKLPETESFLPLLPPGLRGFALYVHAHYLYLREEYSHSAGIVEATLSMGAARYPIPAIYLHLVAVMDYMSLKQTEKARTHLLAAWALAQPDDLIEGFGEHHGLLGGMLEAEIKPAWPEDFKRVIAITYRFSAGWRKVHNPETGHDVADDLTTTEFAVSMLAARGWTNQEIAAHLRISPNTVKRYLSAAMEKLHISHRQDLKQFMLR